MRYNRLEEWSRSFAGSGAIERPHQPFGSGRYKRESREIGALDPHVEIGDEGKRKPGVFHGDIPLVSSVIPNRPRRRAALE